MVSPTNGTFNSGEQVNITAVPSPEWTFNHWEGDVTGTNPASALIMNSDKSITAFFTIAKYSFKTSINPAGGGIISPDDGLYDSGAQVMLTAIPSAGYQFNSWSGDVSGTNSTIIVTMNSNKSVIANFTRLQFTLTTSTYPQGSGSVSPGSASYNSGAQVTLTASSSPEWLFDHWEGDAYSTSTSVTITMTSNKSVVAHFVRVQYTLTTNVYPSGAGSISPNGGTYDSNTQITLTATPASGYQFNYWSGSVSGTNATVTLTMNSNKSVTAIFSLTGGGGTNPPTNGIDVTIESISDFTPGGTASVTIRTVPNAHVMLWMVNPSTGTRSAYPSDRIRDADTDGIAQWEWTLSGHIANGEGRIEVYVTTSTDATFIEIFDTNNLTAVFPEKATDIANFQQGLIETLVLNNYTTLKMFHITVA